MRFSRLSSPVVWIGDRAERTGKAWAHSCLTLAQRVLEELENIDQKYLATIGGRSVKMIEISIERPEKDIMLQRLVSYLDQIASDLKNQTLGDQEIKENLEHRLQARCILHEACNLDQAKIRVRKPARPQQRLDRALRAGALAAVVSVSDAVFDAVCGFDGVDPR